MIFFLFPQTPQKFSFSINSIMIFNFHFSPFNDAPDDHHLVVELIHDLEFILVPSTVGDLLKVEGRD